MMSWTNVERFLLDAADGDLRNGTAVNPCLVAYQGDAPLVCAFLRSFEKGEYHQPMIELLALAAGLEADRLAVSFPGRAWSLDDPIPPVVEGGPDLRQRVVVLTVVVADAQDTVATSVISAYEVHGGQVTWQPPVRVAAGEGWITRALTVAAEHRGELTGDAPELRLQAARCQRLGHLLAFGPSVADLLAAARR